MRVDTTQQRVQQSLLPSERLLWSGAPDPAAHFTRSDLFLVPFSIFWAGFVVFWEAGAVTQGAPLFFVLWAVPFVLIGLHMLVGRFFYKSFAKRRTVYAITDRRVLVLGPGARTDELPTTGSALAMSVSHFAGRLSVRFGAPAPSPFGMLASSEMYVNTGMDFFTRSQPGVVRFVDVADVLGLQAALNTLRALQART